MALEISAAASGSHLRRWRSSTLTTVSVTMYPNQTKKQQKICNKNNKNFYRRSLDWILSWHSTTYPHPLISVYMMAIIAKSWKKTNEDVSYINSRVCFQFDFVSGPSKDGRFFSLFFLAFPYFIFFLFFNLLPNALFELMVC